MLFMLCVSVNDDDDVERKVQPNSGIYCTSIMDIWLNLMMVIAKSSLLVTIEGDEVL